ncbi:hypothetical protein C6P46_006067 [Rhodotorula mucilaginosa]|uniref:Uncharacterized protein n=1 Tax=Rhodotorula mucilaginosa TaxID=5537 RepID=A0A9P7B4S6_RHOMI|nr:hypothetical protein C6P46_006067 [Rhodotorula mucilaginosa]
MLPVVDLDIYRESNDASLVAAEARKTAEALIEYGALVVRDSRVSEEANERFLDVMEDYFAQPYEALQQDLRPEPKCRSSESCRAVIAALDPEERPLDLEGGHADPNFFYRMGKAPPTTEFPSLRMENVIPHAFATTWQASMEEWGTQIKSAVEGVSEMLAEGLGLERSTFLRAGEFGSHLLAPTATDLQKSQFSHHSWPLPLSGLAYLGAEYGQADRGQAPARLFARTGRQAARADRACGVPAGYHEVVCTSRTVAALKERLDNRSTCHRPQIRISSTFFHHLSSDETLSPIEFSERAKSSEVVQREVERLRQHGETWDPKRYDEGLKVGELVQNELREIALHASAPSPTLAAVSLLAPPPARAQSRFVDQQQKKGQQRPIFIASPSQWSSPDGSPGDDNGDYSSSWRNAFVGSAAARRRYTRAASPQSRALYLPGAVGIRLKSAIDRVHDLTEGTATGGFNKSLVLRYPEPQPTFFSQLVPDVRYITSMSYGGHANQLVGIINLLYLAKVTNRVAIIPTLTPLHFSGLPQDLSVFYDLDRFVRESGIPAIQLSDLKPFAQDPSQEAATEKISCWSVLERVAGNRNFNDGSMLAHGMDVRNWPLPMEPGPMIWAEDLHEFDYDLGARLAWIKRVNHELLPQRDPPATWKARQDRPNLHENLKDGFDPGRNDPPSDQVLCLDNTFFIATRVFPPAIPPAAPMVRLRPSEGQGWIQAGQYLHFSAHLESLADQYLVALFGLWTKRSIPPFISVHIRRGDFEQARGLTSIEAFTDAVQRVRDTLDRRMDDPASWAGAGHQHQRYFKGVRGKDYAVVVTTDESMDSDFVRHIRAELGWRVLDHDHMRTVETLGEWYPTMIDAAVLARGRGFVGTEWSTFSYLAGSRVKFWNGGVEEWTPSLR